MVICHPKSFPNISNEKLSLINSSAQLHLLKLAFLLIFFQSTDRHKHNYTHTHTHTHTHRSAERDRDKDRNRQRDAEQIKPILVSLKSSSTDLI